MQCIPYFQLLKNQNRDLDSALPDSLWGIMSHSRDYSGCCLSDYPSNGGTQNLNVKSVLSYASDELFGGLGMKMREGVILDLYIGSS